MERGLWSVAWRRRGLLEGFFETKASERESVRWTEGLISCGSLLLLQDVKVPDTGLVRTELFRPQHSLR